MFRELIARLGAEAMGRTDIRLALISPFRNGDDLIVNRRDAALESPLRFSLENQRLETAVMVEVTAIAPDVAAASRSLIITSHATGDPDVIE